MRIVRKPVRLNYCHVVTMKEKTKYLLIGIAIGAGADVAIESADMVLVSEDLEMLLLAVRLARATFVKVKQNLFWAFGYNLFAIPLAMLGLLHPLVAEIAMAASSINVVANSLRLRGIVPRM